MWSIRVLVVVVAIFMVSVAATATQPPDLPDPLEGPGVPQLKKSEVKRLNKAIAKFSAGDLQGANKALRKVSGTAAAQLLRLQIDFAVKTEPPVEQLKALCASNPDYAAAWVTLTQALQTSGDESAFGAESASFLTVVRNGRWVPVSTEQLSY